MREKDKYNWIISDFISEVSPLIKIYWNGLKGSNFKSWRSESTDSDGDWLASPIF